MSSRASKILCEAVILGRSWERGRPSFYPVTAGGHLPVLYVRTCRHCGAKFSSRSFRQVYCSESCRRHYQDARRKAERDELKVVRQGWKERAAWLDPWSRCDVDEWTAEEIFANALLDPLPAGLGWEDAGKVKVTSRPGNHEETMRAGKDNEVTARLGRGRPSGKHAGKAGGRGGAGLFTG